METDIENTQTQISSKIPIRVREENQKNVRVPLEAFTGSSVNVASSSTAQETNLFKLHRNITIRKKRQPATSWEFKVFRDEGDGTVAHEGNGEEKSGDKQIDEVTESVEVRSRTATPVEHILTRNVKKSLKRPHSRELLGSSPVLNTHREVVKRKLDFNESFQRKFELLGPTYTRSLNVHYTYDIFNHLLEIEEKPVNNPKIACMTRACIIDWIMKINGSHGNPATVQCACWFFDSLLRLGQINVDKLQLMAAACYWIAQKLQGPSVGAKRLVKYSCAAFTSRSLENAEKLVLVKLKFPSQPVVPHDFITYMSWWSDSENANAVEVGATFLCMSGIMISKALCREYPSVIAAAAVSTALLLLDKQEHMALLQQCPVYQAAEKKTECLSEISSKLRRAVRNIATPLSRYKTPLEHYGASPHNIAQRIIQTIRNNTTYH